MHKTQLAIDRERIHHFLETKKMAIWICRQHGPQLIDGATATISLRELSRKTGLSITYLSLAKTGKTVLSPAAFLKIANEVSQ